MDRFTAFLDSNVLYPAALRNFLMWLTLHGLFRARWSNMVHEEWMAAVQRNFPDVTRERLEHTRDLMNLHAEDCLVTGFEGLIQSLELTDPDDRHVLAAAISSGAKVIVTRNLKDFPQDKLEPYEIEAQHPDTFITHLIELNPRAVVGAAQEPRESAEKRRRIPGHTGAARPHPDGGGASRLHQRTLASKIW